RVLPLDTLRARLAEHSPTADCAARIRGEGPDAPLFAVHGAVAHMYAPLLGRGQQHRRRAVLACIDATLQAAVRDARWLNGAVWLPPESPDTDGLRVDQVRLGLREAFARAIPVHRRDRLEQKLRRIIDHGPVRRSGDAVLFAAARWVFADPSRGERDPLVASGGLTGGAMQVPFLIASTGLSDVAESGLRTAPIELADLAPTVLSLVEAPEEVIARYERPPAVVWQKAPTRRLTFNRADRRIGVPHSNPGPVVHWEETADEMALSLTEPTELWPADAVRIRLGDRVFEWKPATSAFGIESPCTYEEADGQRAWRCHVAVDRRTPKLWVTAVERRAAPGAEGTVHSVAPAIIGDAAPEWKAPPEVVCADADKLRLKAPVEDALGVARLEVFPADDDLAAPDRIPGALTATAALGALQPWPVCAEDAFTPACQYPPLAATTEPVAVPFPAVWLKHLRKARELPDSRPIDGAVVKARFAAAEGRGAAPERAFLMVRACNLAGKCTARALLSDRDYQDRLAAGCP
ncbi:MAG: hypothetical protein KC620_22380, partial [Myxococcales bacterium]|nr:hypothetical protein [Myxococcales bacterium]